MSSGLKKAVLALSLAMALVVRSVWALPAPSIASAMAQPVTPAVTIAPPVEAHTDSPRAAIELFYKACEDGNYTEAATFLELRTSAERDRGVELAKRLLFVLDKRLWVEPESLSPEKKIGPEELGTITDKQGHKIVIRLVWSGPRARWLFASDTVSHVDPLFNEIDEKWTRQFFPSLLTKKGPHKLEYWQWLLVPIIIGVAWLLGLIIRPIARGIASIVLAGRQDIERSAEGLAPTVGYVTGLGSSYFLFGQLRLYEPAQAFIERWLLAVLWLVLFHGLWRVARIVLDAVASSGWAAHRPSARGFLPFANRAFGAMAIFFGIVSILSSLGYNVTGLLTGLGIGGVAVALAAQKTVENLFGSFSLSVDQPFRVGDTILVDGTTGTVEGIGLRSTRIRTLDRTLVTIPNGKLADMKVETISFRDRLRSTQVVRLSPKADTAKIDDVLKTLRAAIFGWDDVIADGTSVRVRAINEAAIELEVIVSFAITEPVAFNERQQALIFEIARCVEHSGVELGATRPPP